MFAVLFSLLKREQLLKSMLCHWVAQWEWHLKKILNRKLTSIACELISIGTLSRRGLKENKLVHDQVI